MSITYAWPSNFKVGRFEMRVLPNVSAFTAPYTKSVQTLDMLGERWAVKLDLTIEGNPVLGAAREAFFDRLRGPINLIALWNIRFPVPQGTLRGSPTLAGAVAQLSNLLSIAGGAAFSTLLAGDMLGVGGQLVRVMSNATADTNGLFTGVEVMPRMRVAVASGASVAWNAPTANFMIKADGVPTSYTPEYADVASLDMLEVF